MKNSDCKLRHRGGGGGGGGGGEGELPGGGREFEPN